MGEWVNASVGCGPCGSGGDTRVTAFLSALQSYAP